MYLNINESFSFQIKYIIVVHISKDVTCQLHRNEKPKHRQLQHRIHPYYKHVNRLSMDLKVMPGCKKGHKFILTVTDEITNITITIPIYQPRSEEIGDALIEYVL